MKNNQPVVVMSYFLTVALLLAPTTSVHADNSVVDKSLTYFTEVKKIRPQTVLDAGTTSYYHVMGWFKGDEWVAEQKREREAKRQVELEEGIRRGYYNKLSDKAEDANRYSHLAEVLAAKKRVIIGIEANKTAGVEEPGDFNTRNETEAEIKKIQPQANELKNEMLGLVEEIRINAACQQDSALMSTANDLEAYIRRADLHFEEYNSQYVATAIDKAKVRAEAMHITVDIDALNRQRDELREKNAKLSETSDAIAAQTREKDRAMHDLMKQFAEKETSLHELENQNTEAQNQAAGLERFRQQVKEQNESFKGSIKEQEILLRYQQRILSGPDIENSTVRVLVFPNMKLAARSNQFYPMTKNPNTVTVENSANMGIFFMNRKEFSSGMSKPNFVNLVPDSIKAKKFVFNTDQKGHITIMADNEKIEISENADKVTIVRGDGTSTDYPTDHFAVWLLPYLQDSISTVRWGDQRTYTYKGQFFYDKTSPRASSGEKFWSLVNWVDLDDYLRSVVISEMPTQYNGGGRRIKTGIAALKAQAIASRTYAFRKMMQARAWGSHPNTEERAPQVWDLDPTVRYQAYSGAIDTEPETDQAVKFPSMVVMLTEDKSGNLKPIEALFHSHSGGETMDAVDADQILSAQEGQYPYLKSVTDAPGLENLRLTPADQFDWKEKVRLSQILAKKNRKELLEKLDLTKVSLNIITAKHSKHASRWQLDLGDDKLELSGSETYDIERDNGFEQTRYYTLKATEVISKDGQPTDVEFSFHGRGFGHGVGLSQWGAFCFALGAKGICGDTERGAYSYEDILCHYYPGVKIAQIQSADANGSSYKLLRDCKAD